MEQGKQTGHLFTVEILIEDQTNGLALEKLLHLLNSNLVKDYHIKEGIELGKLIEMNMKANLAASHGPSKTLDIKKPTPVSSASPNLASAKVLEQLEAFKQNNTLIRLTVIKGKGVKLNLPCRILNFDSSNQNVTVYHVDEKKVYLFKLNEIEDFSTV